MTARTAVVAGVVKGLGALAAAQTVEPPLVTWTALQYWDAARDQAIEQRLATLEQRAR
jgi:hypothetical protein